MDPITMAILFAVGATANYTTAYFQGKAQEEQYENQADWQAYNAKVEKANQEREDARLANESASRQLDARRRGRKEVAKSRALLSSSGLSVASGSPLMALASTEAEYDLQARREAYKTRTQRSSLKRSSKQRILQYKTNQSFYEDKADNAMKTSMVQGLTKNIQMGTSLLGGLM